MMSFQLGAWRTRTLMVLSIASFSAAALAQENEKPNDPISPPDFQSYQVNQSLTVLPAKLQLIQGGPSSQLLSRQDIIEDRVGYTWNVTLQYAFILPDTDQMAALAGDMEASLPNTIEYQTYIAYLDQTGQAASRVVDAGTSNITAPMATTLAIDFPNSEALADFIASGADLELIAIIEFAQMMSVSPRTNEIQDMVVDYLANNVIPPNAPVLDSFRQLSEAHPDLVGSSPALVLSALSSVFDQAVINLDELGEPELVLPPAFEVSVSQAFSGPSNIRFTDRAVARMQVDLCGEGNLILFEIGLEGCENVDQLIDRFDPE